MFTGIVEELGRVASLDAGRLRISAATVLDDVCLGASIAVNGCCLTVVAWEPPGGSGAHGWWDAELSEETLARTTLCGLTEGDPVNLERAVRLEDRMGGHLVQGHVDAVGTVRRPVPDLEVAMPPGLRRYVVEKGSITVDGVSLTVVEPLADGFSVAVIPHTAEVTTLGRRGTGDPVNLEVDVMAKYTESLIAAYLQGGLAEEDTDVA
ncbi:MAG: riboflavin synthase [Microthrixaceae bacterium]|nr:riboflavin synthase [Microthrixaceae bacterium]